MEKKRPDIYQNTIEDIPFAILKENGIKLLLVDIDNTLLRYKEQQVEQRIEESVKKWKRDFQIVLFSNGSKKRVKKVAEQLRVPFVACALKPWRRNFLKVLKEWKVEPCEAAIIGDQLLTDIKGGNRVGITTILINPLSNKDAFLTSMNRKREERAFKKMSAKGIFFKGRYYE